MKIYFFNHNLIWRSAFHRCFQLARPLVRQGHSVTILTNSEKEMWRWKESIIDGVRVVESPDLLRGPLRTGWDPMNVLRRCQWVQEEVENLKASPEKILVHAFDSRPTVIHPALLMRKLLSAPLVMDWGDWWGHGGAIRLRKPAWLNLLFEPIEVFYEEHFKQDADHLTCVSHPLRERATRMGIPRDRITLIRNCADPAATRVLDRQECRAKLKLQKDRHYAIFSGYVLYDLEQVFEAMKILARRSPGKWGLIVTGSLAQQPPSIEGCEWVMTGTVPRATLNEYLCAADVALMPLSDHLANQARFPGKVGDYLAAGLPILMNPVGDIAKILKPQELGYFCDESPGAMASTLESLLKDPTGLKDQGVKGREFVEREFNWEREAGKLMEVYRAMSK